MTPFKDRRRLHSERGGLMFDDCSEGNDSDELMVSSPPRVPGGVKSSLPSANLFGENDDSSSNYNPSKRRFPRARNQSVLRSLDMNQLEPTGAVASPMKWRKRPTDSHVSGREEMWEDSDEDMFQSPKIHSPKSSPTSYRTMDGRTVTSKNPFSPYTPCEMEDDDSPTMQTTNAPQFPCPFNYPRNIGLHLPNSNTAPSLAKINLQRRDMSSQGASPFPRTYLGPSKTGYPDQQGQYSFTGSPIEEVDIVSEGVPPAMNHKFRRLHRDHDEINKSRRYRYGLLSVDTTLGCKQSEEISPTDVMSFPPSTPVKAARSSFTPTTPEHGVLITSSTRQAAAQKSRFNQDFDVISQLGNGSFGTVYKCLSRLDGCMYAVKTAKRKAKGKADRDRMLKEVYALAALCDQADTAAFNIVRYHQAWMEEDRLYIQTELCSFTLDTEIKRGQLSSITRRYKLLREILVALEFIHRNGMVHLDIKPENIFVKNDQYKLGDFGLVSKTSTHEDVEEGDSRYMSMELLSGDHSDLTKSDIFSMGATMYQVCLGRELPMHGQEWQEIRAGELQSMGDTPFALELIIKSMMDPNASDRPHPSQLLKKNELLSDEQKQLLREKEKVLQVNMALALQTERMKKLTPPRPGGLARANTWNGSLPKWI